MKGLLYCGFLLNKKWFLIAGIIAVLGTAACVVLYNSFQNSDIIISFACVGVQAVVAVLCTEWLGRSFESDIKCRFADYVLASGISKYTFVLSELVKNIMSIAISYAICIVIQLVMQIRDRGFFDPMFLLGFILLIGVIRWITSLVTIRFRNAEKAGLVVGIAFGFGIILPTMIVIKSDIMAELIFLHKFVRIGMAFTGALFSCYRSGLQHSIRNISSQGQKG